MLRNGDKDGLMVRSGVDGCDPVSASGETSSDVRVELAVDSWVVEALEECKRRWVSRRSLGNRVERLDDDVRVSLNVAV